MEILESFRKMLLEAGMQEPQSLAFGPGGGAFFRQDTPLTAFVVNLRCKAGEIYAVYGFASTAFTRMAGCEHSLRDHGIGDQEITVRQKAMLRNPAEEQDAARRIQALYETYHLMDKDSLLAARKKKQAEFLARITRRLKPLGFRKKGNTWSKPMEEPYELLFEAQKSAFSDEFYFNILISRKGTDGYCYYTRVAPDQVWPLDWQTFPEKRWEAFLDQLAEQRLPRLMQTPLWQLGKDAEIRRACCCAHRCSACWLELPQG